MKHELDDLTDEERAAMPAIIVEWLAAGESGSRDKLVLVFERFATRCGKALLTATAENERLKALLAEACSIAVRMTEAPVTEIPAAIEGIEAIRTDAGL